MQENTSNTSNLPFSGTLVGLLRYRANTQPSKMAYTFLRDGETEELSYTFAELDQQARIIATKLQSMAALGSRVLLLYPNGVEYVAAFFGCLYAGMIAVPAYPPRRNRSDQRLATIAANAGAGVILTTADVALQVNNNKQLTFAPELEALSWVATDSLSPVLADAWQMPQVTSESLAFLQYTSGSTGSPKGVMVSHANLLHNLRELELTFDYTADSIMVTWLPIFHDMGLIYGILGPCYSGYSCYLMMPVAFLQKPLRWLEALSRYGGTHTAAPNFAFDLCVQRATPEQLKQLDLSRWRAALNGAEPVRQETLESFATTFAPCGFRPTTFCPGYGLAEGTLVLAAVNAPQLAQSFDIQAEALSRDAVLPLDAAAKTRGERYLSLVGCGGSEIDTRIAIVNPQNLNVCAPDGVGEIWAGGLTIAQGYWENQPATEETFQAFTSAGDGPFLRTGDMGFVHEGNLYITGRLKDVIVIRGANYYPNDIELSVEQSHPSLNSSGAAAFSVEVDGEERLVVMQEIKRTELKRLDVEAVMNAIRGAVSEQHELQLYAIILINPATLPKTSSGKVQRRACRDAFVGGTIDKEITRWQQLSTATAKKSFSMRDVLTKLPASVRKDTLQVYLQDEIIAILGLDPATHIDPRARLFVFGLDSLLSVALKDNLERGLDSKLRDTLFFDFPTLDVLVPYLLDDVLQLGKPATVEAAADNALLDDTDTDDLLALIEDELKDVL